MLSFLSCALCRICLYPIKAPAAPSQPRAPARSGRAAWRPIPPRTRGSPRPPLIRLSSTTSKSEHIRESSIPIVLAVWALDDQSVADGGPSPDDTMIYPT